MARKSHSNLRVIPADPGEDPHAAPGHLQTAGRQLWQSVMEQYDLSDAGGRATLEAAATALDRAEQLREQIDADGVAIRGKSGLRDNPLLKHETAARALAMRLVARLGLDLEPILKPGRPPGSRR